MQMSRLAQCYIYHCLDLKKKEKYKNKKKNHTYYSGKDKQTIDKQETFF